MSAPDPITPDAVRDFIIAEARRLGFHRVGLVPVQAPLRYQAYLDWIAKDMHGTMAYMAAPEHVAGRADMRALAENARTVVVVALAYAKGTPPALSQPSPPVRGFVARYARGKDYHGIIKKRLHALARALSERIGRPVAARPCTDSAPLLERDAAEAAGIGFVAKNTMLIAPGLGSYTLLGELLLDVDASPSTDQRPRQRCGSCRACLDACPTGAFVDAYVLDARRCISYLTIEHRGWIPRDLRAAMGTMIVGCDICQDVCPFNARAPDRTRPDPELDPLDPERGAPDLLALFALGANQRRRYVEGTPLRRINREQLMRNLCVALGNAGDPRAIEALTRALADRSPIVRGHAAWALGKLGAFEPCRQALASETDPQVRAELSQALAEHI
jgi:epoxyqueuosine reductase